MKSPSLGLRLPLLSLALLLAACGGHRVWCRADRDAKALEKDKLECGGEKECLSRRGYRQVRPADLDTHCRQSLTVTTDLPLAGAPGALATIAAPKQIALAFSEALDPASLPGHVRLQVVKAGGALAEPTPPVEIALDRRNAERLFIRTADGAPLASGQEYRLTVSKAVASVRGNSPRQDFVHGFATDYDFSAAPGPERSAVVILSDVHLGDPNALREKYAWTDKNREALIAFLGLLRGRADVRELVIAGDLLDEWVAPMDHDTFAGLSPEAFVDSIAEANRGVIDAFNALIQDKNVRVVYVPGNHDMLVTAADIDRLFPGIVQARGPEAGLGAYIPSYMPNLRIEHGHRYDLFNAPDPLDTPEGASILPAGFFVSKIASSGKFKGLPRPLNRVPSLGDADKDSSYYFFYKLAWEGLAFVEKVKDKKAKQIKTGIDGYTDVYSVEDLTPSKETANGVPLDTVLFKDVMNRWYERQTRNSVPQPRIPPEIAMGATSGLIMDLLLIEQFFSGEAGRNRVVVLGHTHTPELIDFGALNSVYANSGTWVDENKPHPSCTFVVVYPKSGEGAVDTVVLNQYTGGKVGKLKSASIR